MKIVLMGNQLSPYTKSSVESLGLRFFANALSSAGHQVSIFIPKYKDICRKEHSLEFELRRIRLRLGKGTKEFNLYSTQLPESLVNVYLIDKDLYFGEKGFVPQTLIDERYYFFSLAVLESLKVIDLQPDILFSEDPYALFSFYYLKTGLINTSFYEGVTTIHHWTTHENPLRVSTQQIEALGIDITGFSTEFMDNTLELDIKHLSALFTDVFIDEKSVQFNKKDTIDKQPRKEKFLELALQKGIDESLWNPKTMTPLLCNYDFNSLENKKRNKNAMTLNHDQLLISFLDGWIDQKRMIDCVSDLVALEHIKIVLPEESTLSSELLHLIAPYQDKMIFKPRSLSLEQLLSASDCVVLSDLEDQNQLKQRMVVSFGTIPIVFSDTQNTDTVVDFLKNPTLGNGFILPKQSSQNPVIFHEIIHLYEHDPDVWRKLQMSAMLTTVSQEKCLSDWETVFNVATDDTKKNVELKIAASVK